MTRKPSAATPTPIRRAFCRSETKIRVRQASNSFTLQPHPSYATSVSPYGWKLGLWLPEFLLGDALCFPSIHSADTTQSDWRLWVCIKGKATHSGSF